uniref:Uncharacterized protein n=1 Tax=Arundo donax TaxID=35708 RepID=A0A0A9GGN8_ARUDO
MITRNSTRNQTRCTLS